MPAGAGVAYRQPVRPPTVSVQPLDPPYDDAVAWNDVFRVVEAEQRGELAPAPAEPVDLLRRRFEAAPKPRWLGRLDDRPAGIAEITSPETAVRPAFVRVYVAAECRGRGLGRALLRTIAEERSAAGGRDVAATVEVGSPSAAYAAALGARTSEEVVLSGLVFAEVDPGVWLARVAAGVPGYDLVHWNGPAPDALVDSYALAKRSIADAPNRLGPATPRWDRALVRAGERDRAARGHHLWVSAAVPTGTCTVVAFSAVAVGVSPLDASQEVTVVLPAHRRRGLASLVKADLLRRLREGLADVRQVSTNTSAENVGMRTVNEGLGFRELVRRHVVRVPVAVLAQRVSGG